MYRHYHSYPETLQYDITIYKPHGGLRVIIPSDFYGNGHYDEGTFPKCYSLIDIFPPRSEL